MVTRNLKATLFVIDPANPFRTIEIRAAVELTPDPGRQVAVVRGGKGGVPVASGRSWQPSG